MNFYRFSFLIFILTAGPGMHSLAAFAQQNRVVAFDYPFYSVRANAMAEAHTSEAEFVSDMYVNPASLGFVQNESIVSTAIYYQNASQMQSDQLTVLALQTEQHHLGFGYIYTHPGFKQIDRWAGGSSSLQVPNFQSHHLDIAYSYNLDPRFAVGTIISNQFSYNESHSHDFQSGAVGLLYKPTPDVSYAFVYRGGIRQMQYRFDETATVLGRASYPHAFEIGTSFRFPTSYRQPFMTLSLTNTKYVAEQGMWYKIGGEVRPWASLALRGGYFLGPEYGSAQTGIGIFTRNLTFDYAFALHPDINYRFHQFGISVNLSSNHAR